MGLFDKARKARTERIQIRQDAKTKRVELRTEDDSILATLGISNQQYKSAATASIAGSITNAVSSAAGMISGSPIVGMNKQSYGVGEIYSNQMSTGIVSGGNNLTIYAAVAVVLILLMKKR